MHYGILPVVDVLVKGTHHVHSFKQESDSKPLSVVVRFGDGLPSVWQVRCDEV